jgi:hypothetical protein
MRKLDDTNRTRKKNVRHSWVKAGPGIQRCAICGITKQSEWRDGKAGPGIQRCAICGITKQSEWRDGKAGPGIQRCAICGITKQSEWRDGKTSHCVYLSSGELYSMTGETPECRDLSEFY